MERYSGDSDNFDPETMMTQLRHDLADAMMDTQHSNRGRNAGKCAFSLILWCFSGSCSCKIYHILHKVLNLIIAVWKHYRQNIFWMSCSHLSEDYVPGSSIFSPRGKPSHKLVILCQKILQLMIRIHGVKAFGDLGIVFGARLCTGGRVETSTC